MRTKIGTVVIAVVLCYGIQVQAADEPARSPEQRARDEAQQLLKDRDEAQPKARAAEQTLHDNRLNSARAHIEASFIKRRLNSPLWLHEDNSKANVVVATFRLEPQPKRRAAGPALVRPATASAHTGRGLCQI